MTKAVVLEIKEEYAAVLTDQGLVRKIRSRQYKVGQEITLPDAGERTFAGWRQMAAAAAVVIALSGASLHYASENVFAYSTVTVSAGNEAVELTLNKKDEVIAVKALDENSKAIAESMKESARKRRPLEETVGILISEMEQPEIVVESENAGRKENLENDLKKIIPERSVEIMPEKTDPAGTEGMQSVRTDPSGNISILENMQPGTERRSVSESGMEPSQGWNRNNTEKLSEGMQGIGEDPSAGKPVGPVMP